MLSPIYLMPLYTQLCPACAYQPKYPHPDQKNPPTTKMQLDQTPTEKTHQLPKCTLTEYPPIQMPISRPSEPTKKFNSLGEIRDTFNLQRKVSEIEGDPRDCVYNDLRTLNIHNHRSDTLRQAHRYPTDINRDCQVCLGGLGVSDVVCWHLLPFVGVLSCPEMSGGFCKGI